MSNEMKKVVDSAKAQEFEDVKMGLKEMLKEASTTTKAKIPAQFVAEMEQANEDLKAYDFRSKTLQLGDVFPMDATLLNHNSEDVTLESLLKDKKMIISFYRGAWCPYCNLEMNYYNRLLMKEENAGVEMIAVSPELPDVTIAKKDVEALNFKVYSDKNNVLARQLNLVFELPENIQNIYKKFGIYLEQSQGNTDNILPIPAVFVIDSNAKVVYVELDEDYTTRPDALEVIEAYKKAE